MPDPTLTTSPLPTGPPDWPSISEDITCPLCSYNLRGLENPRCPECGFAFEWRNLLHPEDWKHPYLFEHHPERSFWSFSKTLFASVWPRHFWRLVHPRQPGNTRRLVIYWMLAQTTVLLVLIPIFVAESLNVRDASRRWRTLQRTQNLTPEQMEIIAPLQPSWWYFQQVTRQVWRRWLLPSKRSAFFFIFTAWPWMTFGALLSFQISMHKARLRAVHVLRCTLYSSDILFWYYPLIAAAMTVQLALASAIPAGGAAPPLLSWLSYLIMAATALIVFALPCRLWIAYRLYLRFDHPFWTVLASQVIVFFAMLVCADQLGMIR